MRSEKGIAAVNVKKKLETTRQRVNSVDRQVAGQLNSCRGSCAGAFACLYKFARCMLS